MIVWSGKSKIAESWSYLKTVDEFDWLSISNTVRMFALIKK